MFPEDLFIGQWPVTEADALCRKISGHDYIKV
jgi:hypothetical protein